jgi:Arc/MetJ-type ribon-helix-helix transcriptional regulator
MKRKIAVSVPAELVDQVDAAVGAGRAASVSAYVTQAIAERIRRDRLEDVLDEMDRELGRPARADEMWAKKVLGP